MDYNFLKNKLKECESAGQTYLKDTCIFIASHISYDNQLEYLDKCLDSLINQKCANCDIYLSISFSNNKYEKKFIKYHNKNKTNLRYLTYIISKEQKFQMEHFKKLTSMFSNKYKYIMFCDDDDTYGEYRLATFYMLMDHFEYNLDKKIFAISDLTDIGEIQGKEYWSYMIKTKIIQEFYELIDGYDDLLKHNHGDMYFSMYLQNYTQNFNNEYNTLLIPECLYNYNKDNPDSICGKKYKDQPVLLKNGQFNLNKDYWKNGFRLGLICKEYKQISYLLNSGFDIKKEDIEKYVPEKKRIVEFTKILYLYSNNKELHNNIMLN